MISCDFAPNESWDDAWISLKLIFQPWRWYKGIELKNVKKMLLSKFRIPNFGFRVFLFLSGRAALYHLLKCQNFPKESEIIVQGFTCEAVILPIIANDLRPVYADVEDATLSINPIELERKITANTRAVVLQHTFGITPKHRESIISITRHHNLLLIEDIAHGVSNPQSVIRNRQSIFLMSFGRSKALSSVFGGAIVTNNKKTIKRLTSVVDSLPHPNFIFIFQTLLYKPLALLIKNTYDLGFGKALHKISRIFGILVPEISAKEKKGHYDSVLDKAYPNALAVLLELQLNKFDQMNNRRLSISSLYSKYFANNFYLKDASFIRFPILSEKREKLVKNAAKSNIYLGKWYTQAVAPAGLSLNRVQYKVNSCPVAERICGKIVNLPTNIEKSDAEKVVGFIQHFT